MILRSHILFLFLMIPLLAISQVNDFCEYAVQLYCGSSASGNLQDLNIDPVGAICTQSYRSDQGGQWYQVAGTGDLFELLISTSNFQPAVSIYKGACDHLECVSTAPYPSNGQPVVFSTNVGENYYIYVQAYYFYGTGFYDFDFTINCLPTEGNYACETAESINFETSVQGTLDHTPYSQINCLNSGFETQAKWYSFRGDGSQIQIVANTNNTGNYFMFIQGSCEQLDCSNSYYLASGYTTPLFPTISGQIYYIVIFNSNFGLGNAYEFSLSQFNLVENALCQNAAVLPCDVELAGDTRQGSYSDLTGTQALWYTFKGDGKGRNFKSVNNYVQIQIFTNNCEALQSVLTNYVDSYHSFNFLTLKNVEYRLSISTANQPDPFSISIECYTPPVNDICSGALPITCGTSYSGNSDLASADQFSNETCYANPQSRGLWYKFTGDNKIHSFRVGGGQVSGLNFQIFQGSCGTLECLEEKFIYGDQPNTFDFYCKSNRNYWLLVSSINDERGLYSFKMDCFNAASNDNCLNGIRLIAGNYYSGDTRLSSPDRQVNCVDAPDGLWYKVVGTGDIYQINNFGYTEFRGTVMSGSCGAYMCELYDQLAPGNSLRFLSERNKVYYILIDQGQGPFSFIFNTVTPVINDVCNKAISLQCGVNPSGTFYRASHDSSDPAFVGSTARTLWYKLTGDGKIHELKYQNVVAGQSIAVFEGDCGNTNVEPLVNFYYYLDSPVRFFAEQNKLYKICLYQDLNQVASPDFILQHTCRERSINDEREGAIEVFCGDVISGSLMNAFQNPIECYPYVEGVWYKFKGTGEVINLKVNYGSIATLISDGNEIKCLDNYYSSNPIVLKSFEGTYYYFTIANTANFTLSVNCITPPVNDELASAISVSCGSVIDGNFKGATPDPQNCYGGGAGIWYSCSGTGDIFNISLRNLSTNITYVLYELDAQGNTICLDNTIFSTGGIYSFYPEPNKEYVFQLAIDHFAEDSLPFTMNIECSPPVKNDICSDAIEVHCGETISLFNDFATVDAIISCYYGVAGVWYHLVGNDSAIQISVDEGTLNSFWIFEGKCEEFICNSGNSNNYFIAYQGKDYYIFIGNPPNEEILFTVTCQALPPGDLCSQAVEIQCGDSIDLFEYALYNPDPTTECNHNGFHYPGKWFSYTSSTNGSITISKVLDQYSVEVSIFDGCNGNCLANGLFPFNVESLTIMTEPGKKYLFLVTSLLLDLPGQAYFTISCTQDSVYTSPCAQEQYLTDMLLPNEIYPNGIIQAASKIEIKNSQINASGHYTWQAGQSVEFQPGFEVKESASMEVRIQPCDPVLLTNKP